MPRKAMTSLGNMYKEGLRVAKNVYATAKWYRKAAVRKGYQSLS